MQKSPPLIAWQAQPAAAMVAPPTEGKLARSQKNYAVGLEMSCPGGAYYWAPEIPSNRRLAGTYAEQM
jgi:hypothetical protein